MRDPCDRVSQGGGCGACPGGFAAVAGSGLRAVVLLGLFFYAFKQVRRCVACQSCPRHLTDHCCPDALSHCCLMPCCLLPCYHCCPDALSHCCLVPCSLMPLLPLLP